METSGQRRPLRVALQGGGALGAFSAGVLDAMLASRRIDLTHFSGTSAGAINAVICASALASGGRRKARLALTSFWQAIAASPLNDYVGLLWGPLGQSLRDGFGNWLWSSALSMPNPYGRAFLPSLASTPLKAVLASHVDLSALRRSDAPQVFVTLTNVRTGLPRVVSNADLTLETVLASACLPQYFRAVEIDGDAFWDGGYTGNPTLWPLVRQPGPADIALVQLSPGPTAELPVSAAATRQRIAEIVFHSSLVAEMQAIQAIREVTHGRDEPSCFELARFHRIGPPPEDLLGSGSAADRSPRFLRALWDAGRRDARRFLIRDGRQIGVRETLDLKAGFIDQRKVRLAPKRLEDDPAGRERRSLQRALES